MDIQKEARLVAGSIIEWCFAEDDETEDENYPQHIIENLLTRQKKECINKALNFIKDKVELSYTDYDSFLKEMED